MCVRGRKTEKNKSEEQRTERGEENIFTVEWAEWGRRNDLIPALFAYFLVFFLTFCRPQLDGRSLKKLKSTFYGVKRSIKKVFHAWTYYGPEVGLCSCIFKFAWHTYPVVPEISYAMMGQARKAMSGFMGEFWRGYQEKVHQDDHHHRISDKVAQTTAADYIDYQSYRIAPQSNYISPEFRRVGAFTNNLPENAPLIEKTNPQQLNSVVEMLKNLQPKGNASRFGRNLNPQPQKLNSAQQHHILTDEGEDIIFLAKPGAEEKTAKSAAEETAESRAFAPKHNPPMAGLPPAERAYSYAPPKNIPILKSLPPADYTYVKHGVYHHVHDLRKNKARYPQSTKIDYKNLISEGPGPNHISQGGHGGQSSGKGGWLKFDMEEAIMTALGLSHPGRSIKPTIAKCSKIYIFQVILRFFQKLFIG